MSAVRHQILARRARFVAAAAAIGVAYAQTGCAQTCLSVGTTCDADPEPRLAIEGPTSLCVGDNADLILRFIHCDQQSDSTKDAAFTSSNPSVLAFDNPRSPGARALSVGRATITGNFHDGSGVPTTHVIDVSACSDGGADASARD